MQLSLYGKLKRVICGCLFGASVAAPTLADDIDIFYSSLNSGDADTLVMFALDWRPNLTSQNICGSTCGDFETVFGSYLQCENAVNGDGIAPCNSVSRFEAYKATLKLVIDELTTAGSTGLQLGLMFNHNDASGPACAGPQTPGNKCTNGGYILLRFVDVDSAAGKTEFFDKLDALPSSPQGGASHKWQGAELNFELFRYLTGQDVYNGENGWEDLGTDDTYNINDVLDATNVTTSNANPVAPPGAMSWDTNSAIITGANPGVSSGTYVSPLAGVGECSSVYAVNMLFQVSQQDSESDDAIKETKSNGGMEGIGSKVDYTATIGYLKDANLADGSFNSSVNLTGKVDVTSYFIVDNPNTTTNGYAQAGGTGQAIKFSDDPAELVDTVRSILQEILAESTTFVSTAVAANTLNRAQTREDLYIALFEPNEDKDPFWDGNVKKLKIKTLNVPVVDANGDPVLDANGDPVTEEKQVLVDANNNDAVNPLDGRIAADALTFWTDQSSLSAAPADETDYTDDTDGREVPRGGAGQQIPGFLPGADPAETNAAGRKVLTEPATYTNGLPTALMALDVDDATALNLLADDSLYETVMDCTSCSYATETDSAVQLEAKNKTINMIKFSRGYDVPFDAASHNNPDGRDWWVGAPLHARPLIINYGHRSPYTGTQPDIRILTAGNAGILHMVKDSAPDGTDSGSESWAFLPREFIPAQKRFMLNEKGIHAPGQPAASPRLNAHPYLLDSSATALYFDNDLDGTIETSDNDKVYIFICMRRGGKGCYALDISDPDDPKLLWTIDKTDSAYSELAQTWSLMRAGLVSYEDSSNNLVQTVGLFIGAGYNGDDDHDGMGDLGKDSRVLNSNSSTEIVGTNDYEGNAVYIIDARNGSLVWKAAGPSSTTDTADGWDSSTLTLKVNSSSAKMQDSIPADVFLFDSDGDTITDRFYVPDTGGIVWRGDIVPGPRSSWSMTPVLSVGRHDSATNASDRRMFSRVDVAQSREFDSSQGEEGTPFDAVVVTTGDRAHPTGTTVQDWVYMYKDKNIVSGDPPTTLLTHTDLQDLTNDCLQDGNNSDCTDLDTSGTIATLPKLENGWRVRMNHCGDAALSTGSSCGEKGLSRPLIINNIVFFTSYVPNSGSGTTCELPQGKGLFYAISLQEATGVFDFNLANNSSGTTLERFDVLASPGIPPAPVALAPDTILRPDLVPQPVPPPQSGPTFWYESTLK